MTKTLVQLGLVWNRPNSRKVNPTLCIVVIVPGSVAITYRTHFNRISQTWLTFTTTHGFNYYIIQRIVLRISEYKPLGLKENKQKVETISSLLGNFIFLNLLDPPPQADWSVARVILHIIILCHPVDSFIRILHLSSYPQGWDRFTSPSVYKLYVDADGIKVMRRVGYVFLMQAIYV